MAKLRPGIEIPIIPEDFVFCENNKLFFKTSIEWRDGTQEPNRSRVEWFIHDSILFQQPESESPNESPRTFEAERHVSHCNADCGGEGTGSNLCLHVNQTPNR